MTTTPAAPPASEHLATKADLAQAETRLLLRLGALIVALNGLTIAILKFLG